MTNENALLQGKVALITGASRGIGAAVARRFAGEGAQVVLLARTTGALEELDDAIRADGGAATLIPFDLRRTDDLDNLGPSLLNRFGGLDILVGNAAVLGGLSPVGHFSPRTWSEVLAVGLTANWRLIRTLEPLLRRAPAGRAMFVTSGAAEGHNAYWGAYAAAKAGLAALVRSWAAETRQTALRVNLIDPGRVATAMRAEAYPGEDPASLTRPTDLCDVFVTLAAHCPHHGACLGPDGQLLAPGIDKESHPDRTGGAI